MNAFADGLNYYLSTSTLKWKPRVIKRFEPWMALSFTEGSIGGDIERVNLTQLEAFYGKTPVTQALILEKMSRGRPIMSPEDRTAPPWRPRTPLGTTRCC